MEQRITSRKSMIIKHTVSISSSTEKRQNEMLFVTEGARLCEAAVDSNTEVFRLFYTDKAYGKYKKYIDKIKVVAKEIYIIDDHVASLISSTKNSQDVFCVCRIERKQMQIKGKVLVMENLQDPGNLGTVLRTGEALGIDTFIVLGDCCDLYSPKVTRSTMGAVFRLNILKYENAIELIDELEQNGYTCYGAIVDSDAKKINNVNFETKSAVFIGNEGNGLSQICKDNLNGVTIPMNGRAESLNASSAASIIMWEMVKNV